MLSLKFIMLFNSLNRNNMYYYNIYRNKLELPAILIEEFKMRLPHNIQLHQLIFLLVLGSSLIAATGNEIVKSKQDVPVPYPMTVLLRNNIVQQELGLSVTQKISIEATLDKVEIPLFQLRDLTPENRKAKAEELVNRLILETRKTLSNEQLDRLYQLSWQVMGINSYEEPELLLRIKATSSQSNKIHSILRNMKRSLLKAQQNNQESGKSADISDITQSLYENAKESIMKILTTEQKFRLPKVLGDDFDFSNVKYLVSKAPEFQKVETWLNLNAQELPLLTGKVTVVHFYAFGCINCIHNLPFYNEWQKSYPAECFQIVGIHTPETENEKILDNVKKKAIEYKMTYPIAVDLENKNWDVWSNGIWPSIYLVDKNGFVRYWWYGELNWQGSQTEEILRSEIEKLLAES